MSDHDTAPDPIDEAYARAEAILNDEDARAARRARVLAAVAREPAAPAPPVLQRPAAAAAQAAAAPASPSVRRPAWRRGRWLAAASVAGLGVVVASQIYQPPHPPQSASTSPAAPAAPPPTTQGIAAAPAPPAPALSTAPPAPRAVAAAPPAAAPAAEIPPIAPPPAPAAAPPPQAFPAAAAPPPPPPPPSAFAGAAEQRDEAAEAQSAVSRPTAPLARSESPAGLFSDSAARLGAAAAAGRTAEVQALLDQGVPVDAADADGDTALMKAVQADHPAAAALLRRHGADLDRRNHAGGSARDMATAISDADLNRALGLGP